MEYLKSFLSDLQERFRNPLIGSFIISWLFFNWQITMLALHFFTDSRSTLNFEEFISKINKLSNNNNSVLYPSLGALFYVLVFPFFRIGISFLQGWFSRHRIEYELKGAKGGSISIDKYLVLRENYRTKISELELVIKGESTQIEQNNILNQNLRYKEAQIQQLSNEMNQLQKRRASYYLNGYWNVKFTYKSSIEEVLTLIHSIDISANIFSCYHGVLEKKTIQVQYWIMIMIQIIIEY